MKASDEFKDVKPALAETTSRSVGALVMTVTQETGSRVKTRNRSLCIKRVRICFVSMKELFLPRIRFPMRSLGIKVGDKEMGSQVRPRLSTEISRQDFRRAATDSWFSSVDTKYDRSSFLKMGTLLY